MNVLTARARKINQDGTLGNFIDGFPFKSWDDVYIAWGMSGKNSANLTKVDPSTLGYETGKRDKHGQMIYGGMEIKAFNSISSVEQDEDGIWKLFRASPALKILRGCEYLLRCESSDLEIIKDGE